jgi:hypothetical protein
MFKSENFVHFVGEEFIIIENCMRKLNHRINSTEEEKKNKV